jgi:hypothetical protein
MDTTLYADAPHATRRMHAPRYLAVGQRVE